MIIGIGTDLIEIQRIAAAMEKNDRFLLKIYGLQEQAWLRQKVNPAASAAANFAGKEAVLKVFGTGLRDCQMNEIEILRDGLGKPVVALSGSAAQVAARLGIHEVMISLSHTHTHALAYAIGIRREETCY